MSRRQAYLSEWEIEEESQGIEETISEIQSEARAAIETGGSA